MPHKPKSEPKPESKRRPKPMPKPSEPEYVPLTAAEKRRAEEIEKLKKKQESFALENIEDTLGREIDSKFTRPKKREEKPKEVEIVIPDSFDITSLAMGKVTLPREKEREDEFEDDYYEDDYYGDDEYYDEYGDLPPPPPKSEAEIAREREI